MRWSLLLPWTSNGVSYALQGMKLRYAEFDGWPDVDDYWYTQGTLLRDNVPIGSLSFEQPNQQWISLNLVVGAQKYELQRWLLYQDPQNP